MEDMPDIPEVLELQAEIESLKIQIKEAEQRTVIPILRRQRDELKRRTGELALRARRASAHDRPVRGARR